MNKDKAIAITVGGQPAWIARVLPSETVNPCPEMDVWVEVEAGTFSGTNIMGMYITLPFRDYSRDELARDVTARVEKSLAKTLQEQKLADKVRAERQTRADFCAALRAKLGIGD